MDRKNEMSTVVEEDSDDSSVLSEPESVKIKVSDNKLFCNLVWFLVNFLPSELTWNFNASHGSFQH